MDTTSSSVLKNTNDTTIKLWIDNTFYIPVDSQGFCNGTCYEGALGYIIQLKSDDGKKLAALKIPKLTGDTFRENAYISELMEKEFDSVGTIFGGGEVTGLLNPLVLSSPLRNTINTDGGSNEAKEWHGSRVFVSYHKGKNPQFALVKRNGQKHIFPEGSGLKLKDNSVEELYKSLEDYIIKLENINKKQVIFIDFHNNQSLQDTTQERNGLFQVFSVGNAPEHTDSIWCTFLPSVTYGWAPGTLQEAISLNRCGYWSIQDHIELMINLCSGLSSLHSRGMLHADLRPANIIYRGNPKKIRSYAIADYGSLAQSNPHASPTTEPTGGTILGPILAGERVSVFYSPERQSGQEREAADTAIIYRTDLAAGTAESLFYVVLGWRSELLNDEKVNSELIEKLIKKDSSSSKEQSSNSDNSSILCKGDRIQVRDYIFELDEQEQNKEGKQILPCSKIWKVYQGKITVQTNTVKEFGTENYVSFPIPRTVELRQWSAASDLYSLGAIMLYSLCNQYRLRHFDTEKQHGSKTVELEKDFRDMMNILGSTPYFKSIWPEIDNLRRNLEDIIQKNNTPDKNRVDEQDIKWLAQNGNSENRKFSSLTPEQIKRIQYIYHGKEQSKENKTLEGAVIEVARLITQTVPGIRNILKAVEFDTGRFIFLIHFILCCLHKSSDISSGQNTKMPFVKDRLEQPIADQTNAIDKALERLLTLQKSIFPASLLDQFRSNSDDIAEYNPRPDTSIRVALEQSSKDLKELKETLKEASNKLDDLHKRKHLIPGNIFFLRPNEQQLKQELKDILNILLEKKPISTDGN